MRRPATAAPSRPAGHAAAALFTAASSVPALLDRHVRLRAAVANRSRRRRRSYRRRGHGRKPGRQASRSSVLALPPRIQWIARIGRERRRGGGGVGRLAVVDEQHAVPRPHPLHAVRQARDSCAAPGRSRHRSMPSARRGYRGERRSARCAAPAARARRDWSPSAGARRDPGRGPHHGPTPRLRARSPPMARRRCR